MTEYKSKIISGLIWQYLQRFSTQGIQIIISIVLARLLLPKDFGVVALIGVFITLSGVLIDSGFSNALIQKKSVDQKDYASVFILNLTLSLFLYIVLFVSAPFIALFYNEALLTPVLRIISLSIIFNALNIIQSSVLTRAMQFKKSFKINTISVICSGIVGIILALKGAGVWSLVFSQLTSQFCSVILMWYFIKWRPTLYFSLNRVKSLFNYGSKIMLGAIFNAIYNNVYSIIIGKQYNSTVLGYYNRGALIPTLVVDSISNTLGSVMFPALSAKQDDKPAIKRIVKRMLINSSFIVFFLMTILIVISKPLILILLTDKWLESVPYLQLVCITVAFYPIHAINASAITSVGESGKYLKITMINKILSLTMIVFAIPYGVMTMVIAGSVASFLSTFISAWPSKKAINYSASEQWKDVFPALILSIFAGFVTWPISKLFFNNWITMILQIVVLTSVFLIGSILFKFQIITEVKNLLFKNK